jgi:hypothetical protein
LKSGASAARRDLLRVLLAEVRALRADDVEELQADRRDAAEVAGRKLALERLESYLESTQVWNPLG